MSHKLYEKILAVTPDFYQYVAQSPTQLSILVGSIADSVFAPGVPNNQRVSDTQGLIRQYLPVGWTVVVEAIDDAHRTATVTVTPGAGTPYTWTQGYSP